MELSYVARGIIDGYWEYALSPWDLAGGVLIAREAGAVVSAPDGGKFDLFKGDVLAATPGIYQGVGKSYKWLTELNQDILGHGIPFFSSCLNYKAIFNISFCILARF